MRYHRSPAAERGTLGLLRHKISTPRPLPDSRATTPTIERKVRRTRTRSFCSSPE